MVRARLISGVVFLAFALSYQAVAATGGKVEPVGAFDGGSDALKKVLDPKGYRVLLDNGTEWCKIWLRTDVPASGKTDVEGALFPQLPEGALLGVLEFTKPGATDYRGQAIQPGAYTLRYELMPNDGNHLGVAPSRDFALLVKVADDPGPEVQPKFADLVVLSRKATGTNHPGPMNLIQPESDAAPAVIKDDQEHWIFVDKLKMKTGEPLLFGLVVKGKTAE